MPVKKERQEKWQRQANQQNCYQWDAHVSGQRDRHRGNDQLADDKVDCHRTAEVPFFSFKGQAANGALPVHLEPAAKQLSLSTDRTA